MIDKTRRNTRVIEITEIQVELLQARKKEKATVGSDVAMKPTATEVEANHATRRRITCYSIPGIPISKAKLWSSKLLLNTENTRAITGGKSKVDKAELNNPLFCICRLMKSQEERYDYLYKLNGV